jgi:hypothetical protein
MKKQRESSEMMAARTVVVTITVQTQELLIITEATVTVEDPRVSRGFYRRK